MVEAFLWGLLGASSLVIGGLIALSLTINRRTLGLVMAFGSGVLVSAVAYELVQEAVETADRAAAVGLGLFAGALVFYIGDLFIDRMGGADRKAINPRRISGGAEPVEGSAARGATGAAAGAGMAIVLGSVLDGIPESAVLGLGLIEGPISAAMLAAVFLSNLPEAIAATAGLRKSGWSGARLTGMWTAVALVSALAAMLGYALFDGASPDLIAFVLAFAAGAILTMLADSMMPEAFEHGGPAAGLFTTLGFALAFGISSLE